MQILSPDELALHVESARVAADAARLLDNSMARNDEMQRIGAHGRTNSTCAVRTARHRGEIPVAHDGAVSDVGHLPPDMFLEFRAH